MNRFEGRTVMVTGAGSGIGAACVRRLHAEGALPPGTAMFCGTQAVIGKLGGGEAFEVELHDPVLRRSIRHAYRVASLEVAP